MSHYEYLKAENARLYIATSGVGSSAILDAWKTPGASKYLVGGAFPYSRHEFEAFVGHKVEGYCSEGAAFMLAMESFVRAQASIVRDAKQDGEKEKGFAIGIGITGAVASAEARRGEDRIHAAVISSKPGCSWLVTLTLTKGTGATVREDDEAVCLEVFKDMLAFGAGMPSDDGTLGIERLWSKYFKEKRRKIDGHEIADEVLLRPYFDASGQRGVLGDASRTHVFFPGTFNPLHEGHLAMASEIEKQQGDGHLEDVTFTICTTPVHKPPMEGIDMLKAVAMFRVEADEQPYFPKRNRHLLFTRGDPLFVDKLKQRPGSRWMVGADTLDRMLDPKWGEPTFSVLKAIESHYWTQIYVFPCIWEGKKIDAMMVLQKYNFLGLPGRQCTQHIVSMDDFFPVDVRSSALREVK